MRDAALQDTGTGAGNHHPPVQRFVGEKGWAPPAWPIAAVALMLIWPAIWNGYPLVFADTGTYLGQALIGYVGWDRPPFYSLFMHAMHWRQSLWLVVIGQGLLVAHLLHIVLRVQGYPGPKPLLLVGLALATLTGLPFVTAQLQPDIFTGVVVLCAWLTGFRQTRLSVMERRYLLALFILAVAVHQSHLLLAFGLAGVSAVIWLARGWRQAARAGGRLALPPLVALVGLVTVNALAHKAPAPSPYGSVFLAARILFDETGQGWLARHCPDPAWRICGIRDQLGTDHNLFLWTLDGPLYTSLGGPKGWAGEASALVRAVALENPGGMLRAALANTAAQLVRIDTSDGLVPWPGNPGPERLIRGYFPREHAAFLAARQQHGKLLVLARRLSPLHTTVFFGSLVLLLGVLAVRRISPHGAPNGVVLAALVVAACLGNAAITGALSGPAGRYQARLTWLGLVATVAILLPRPRPVSQSDAGPQAGTSLASAASPPSQACSPA